MFSRKVTIAFEIVVKDKDESVQVLGVFGRKDFVKKALAEILARVNNNYIFFVDSTKKDIKKRGFQKIFEEAEKARFNSAKDALQSGELKA